jgi:APA family basic amino acid/polyamine antiporter
MTASHVTTEATGALARRIGVGTATSVVVANMIGTGIFTTTGLILVQLDAGWLVLLCWVLGGIVALCGALSYAELATMMPRAGGEYVYLREIYGPWAGFLTGWTSFFVGFSAPIAATGVAIAAYLTAAGVIPDSWLASKTIAVGAVAALTAVHYCGVRLGAWVQNALTVLKLVLLFGLVAAGFAFGAGDAGFLTGSGEFWAGGKWNQLGLALLWVMFAYSGWNAAAYLAEEVHEPARTLPRSLLLGTLAVMGIYVLVNLLFFFSAPAADLRGQVAIGDVAVRHLFGEGAGSKLSILIAAGLLSSLSAYVLIGPRVYYAMARDGLFFGFAAKIHPRFETPAASIVAQGACAGVMILSGTFEQLLTYIGFALGIFPCMTVGGLLWLRRRDPGRERPYRVWGYPLVPVLYLAAMAWILAISLWSRPGPSLLAIITVAAGLPFYWLTRRNKSS